ncbi:helix-turn-helix transcriptional regulator [Actinokineospora enzanensis]|uniref:helix-turn-helix transcriptional regulator n=1 Tax=Actinokineospora enzanensis TaxID=155975 RepID=UPI0005274474|nr:helix-turn-helix transcriptional regulator [Actinokineospora enzanensis]
MKRTVGDLIREWRKQREISQIDLALRADVSTRHLSFVETGRSAPSRAMVLRLAERLDVPLRERNRLLLAAGYAPEFAEGALDTPRLSLVRAAIRRVLTGHEPYPALVVDGGWDLVEANSGVAVLLEGAPEDLLAPPFNVLRYSLHPRGLAARMVNLAQWRDHVLIRLERQMRAAGDSRLVGLHRELAAYPATNDLVDHEDGVDPDAADVLMPVRILHDGHELSLFSTVTTFGTPRDITVEELHVENFYPADAATEKYLRSGGTGRLGPI